MRAVNLIPVEQRAGQPVGVGRSQGAAYGVLALVGGLAVMAYAYGKADHRISSERAQAAALTQQARQVQAASERLAPYTSFVATRETRVQAVQTLIDSRFDWAHVLHEFGRVLPSGVSISSLDGTIGAASSTSASTLSPSTPSTGASSAAPATASATSATPPGSIPSFTLSGCASTQRTVALTLQRLRLIDGVKEVTLQSSAGGGGGSAGGGSGSGCAAGDPVFSVEIVFDPLPETSAVAAATRSVSDGSSTTPSAGAASKGSTR